MNIVRFQDIKLTHRNPMHSYTLTVRKQKEKLRKQFHSPLQQKKDKILSNAVAAAATASKSLQSCPTPCDPIDGRPPGSPIPGILQARVL